jgi:hypothetical protein
MARANFFGEISNFIDFVEPMCCSGVERARLAVEACKSNKELLNRVLRGYTQHARHVIRSETASLEQSLVDSVIPAPAPKLDPGAVTPAKSEQALRMLRRIDALVDALVATA